MNILILAAMDKELSLLVNLLENYQETEIAGLSIKHGNIGQHKVSVSKCGIGKVNSAVNAYKLIETLKPDLVLNSGVAGGAGLPIGSILIADSVSYSDVWCGPGTEYGQADGVPLYMKPSKKILDCLLTIECGCKLNYGLICTGDKFISTPEEISFIRSHFPDVKAVDMESAAISQVCVMNDVSFAIIRVVSDTPGEGENIEQYKNFWVEAPQKTFNVIHKLISSL